MYPLSHIFWEGNNVADNVGKSNAYSDNFDWWDHNPSVIVSSSLIGILLFQKLILALRSFIFNFSRIPPLISDDDDSYIQA